MRCKSALIILAIFSFFSFLSLPSSAFAQTQTTSPYEDYLFNYNRYQTEFNKLITAKAAYKKDPSLQNLTGLLETSRTTYLTIGDTMIAYCNYLQSESTSSGVVPSETMAFFNSTLQSVNQWYIDQKSVINGEQKDLETMQLTLNNYHKSHQTILIKVNQLRLISSSARIAKLQDNAKILLAKLFTHINNNVSNPDPRQEIWRAQIIERVEDTNTLIRQNFELIPKVDRLSSGGQNNSKITKNTNLAIENIRKTASYLNEINNTL